MVRMSTVTLTGASTNQTVKKGEFAGKLPEKMIAPAIRAKVQLTINKSDAGNTTLSTAQKLAILAAFTFDLKYGSKRRTPYSNVTFRELRTIQRILGMSEIENYSDTTNGLGKTIAGSGNTSLWFYVLIPLGLMRQVDDAPNWWGMGPEQLADVELTFRRGTEPLSGTLSLTGNVTIDLLTEPVPGENLFTYIPEFYKTDITNFRHAFEDGCWLHLADRNAVHASTSYNSVTLKIGDRLLYEQVTPEEYISSLNDVPGFSSEASLVDEHTILYQVPPHLKLRDLAHSCGPAEFNQPNKNYATMLFSVLRFPLVSEEEIREDVQRIANLRGRAVKFVNRATVQGFQIPSGLQPFMPWQIMTQGEDSGFELLNGIGCFPGGKAGPMYSEIAVAQAKQYNAAYQAAGAPLAAAAVVKAAALAVPGAVQSGEGFSASDSATFNAIKLRVEA